MQEVGHFQRLRNLIADLSRSGIDAHVFTDRRFEADVRRSGGRFVDLFAAYPLERADSESLPLPCRYVSFAGSYAERIAADLARLGPGLIIYDTFAVVGHVVGRLLGVPYVNVCAGHGVDPERFLAALAADPRVSISASCRRAVATLRERYGIEDASPFSYVSGLSPYLNVYCEPPAFLGPAERRAFEPLAFYGSLPALEAIDAMRLDRRPSPFVPGPGPRIYASLGTVVWRYWPGAALDLLASVSAAISTLPDARGLISLGGGAGPETAARLRRPNVAVAECADQWRVLAEADAFVTHHGLSSTHEAIFNRVPMLSCPFFWDQPALAETCRRLDIAVPLSESPRGPVAAEDVLTTLAELSSKRGPMRSSLSAARELELETIANRGEVLRRIDEVIAG